MMEWVVGFILGFLVGVSYWESKDPIYDGDDETDD